jgi:hypothetical protein
MEYISAHYMNAAQGRLCLALTHSANKASTAQNARPGPRGRPFLGQSAQADFANFQRRIHSLRLGTRATRIDSACPALDPRRPVPASPTVPHQTRRTTKARARQRLSYTGREILRSAPWTRARASIRGASLRNSSAFLDFNSPRGGRAARGRVRDSGRTARRRRDARRHPAPRARCV